MFSVILVVLHMAPRGTASPFLNKLWSLTEQAQQTYTIFNERYYLSFPMILSYEFTILPRKLTEYAQQTYTIFNKRYYLFFPMILPYEYTILPRKLPKSRSEQAPGCGFHPQDESAKIYCVLLGPSWCKKRQILKDRFHAVHMNYW